MDVKNRIGNLIEIDWQKDLFELQPANVKVPVNYSHLKQSILKHGFALPFAVWNDDGKAFCVDGHTRKTILTELISEGVKVPKKLKAFEVLAEDRKEAIQILIEVYNQKHNPFAGEIFDEWMEIESITITEITMPSLNVSFDKFDGFEMEDFGSSYSDKNKEIVIDWFLGSGTALIASEHTGRKGRFTEVEPVYVQGDIIRYINYCEKRGININFEHLNGELTLNDFLNERDKLSNPN